MSRHVQVNQEYEMAYGRDHICGLFIQIFERRKSCDDDEGLIVNLDEHLEGGLTPERMVAVAEEYGFVIELPEKTINIE